MLTCTAHAYSDLLYVGGRYAVTEWRTGNLSDAVGATLRYDDEAIILRVSNGTEALRGYAPGGMAPIQGPVK